MSTAVGRSVLVALVVLTGPAAQARPPQGSARWHVQQGERYYRLSDFPEALREFEAAYRIEPRADILFNVARCHEVMANVELAIRYYRRYLQGKPDADDREVVELRIRNLQKRLDQPPRRSRWKAATGWTGVTVGGALLVTGIVFGALASGKAEEFSSGVSQGKTFTALQAINRDGERYQQLQIATLVAGGVLAAAGGALLLWDHRSGASSRAERAVLVAPVCGGGGLGLAAAGRF